MQSRRALSRVIAAAAVAVMGAIAVSGPAAAQPAGAPGAQHRAVRAAQHYLWYWTDQEVDPKTSRSFTESEYTDQAGLPRLVVTATPARPSHAVYLQFYQRGRWLLEDKASLNAAGAANLELDPYCDNGSWCEGSFKYRLKIGAQYQILKIRFAK